MIRPSEYHTIHHIIHVYGENSAQSPRRMFTTACSFASHFRQQMAQNADLPSESCKNFSGVIPPNPRPVLGHRAVLYRDSRCFGSHNFQIVPAHLLAIVTTQTRRFFSQLALVLFWKTAIRCHWVDCAADVSDRFYDMPGHGDLVHWLLCHTHRCVVHRPCTPVYVPQLLAQLHQTAGDLPMLSAVRGASHRCVYYYYYEI